MAQESTNTFSGGLNKDLNSIATKNTLLTDSKNMTFITFNGNEMSMQNDMGNTKLIYQQTDDDGNKTGDVVDVALSEGFVPVGMKEHGGILYIASYNKAENKGEIGTFPSPEYNTESTLKVLDSNFDLYKAQIDSIKEERERIYHALKDLGYKVYPSEANFLYVLMDDSKNDALLENKIYIRKFRSGVYRITIGKKEENDKLLEVLK